MRLDQFLTGKEGIKSRSAAQKLITEGFVTVNGSKATKPAMDIETSDDIKWTLPTPAAIPEKTDVLIDIPVLYEDDSCMVIAKPASLTVHPGNGTAADETTLLDALKPLFAERGLPYSPSEILAHRLDKETTGCLLIAKTGVAHLALQKQFADRTVDKRYLALVFGIPSPATAMIDAPIGRSASARTKMSVHQSVAARDARTTYRTLATVKGAALLECELHTGRTHQIRVHLKTVGHPILGDETYGNADSEDFERSHNIDVLCLHAWKLTFVSPATEKKVSVTCTPPKELSAVLESLGIETPTA